MQIHSTTPQQAQTDSLPTITNLAHVREARKILRTAGLRPSLYRLARHVLRLTAQNPYARGAS